MARDFVGHYEGYYEGTSEWRELCAVAKAGNVERLWTDVGRPVRGTRVLEIGCGEGAVALELQRRGFTVEGAEVSASGAEAARSRGLTVMHYDGEELPHDDDAFDLAVLSHVIEHVANPRAVLAQAQRVARWVFVEVPIEDTWRLPDDFEWTDLGHINTYSVKTARHLLQSSGIEVRAEVVTNYPRAESQYRLGRAKGAAHWAVRDTALRLAPALARRLFVYHAAYLGEVERDSTLARRAPGTPPG